MPASVAPLKINEVSEVIKSLVDPPVSALMASVAGKIEWSTVKVSSIPLLGIRLLSELPLESSLMVLAAAMSRFTVPVLPANPPT